MFFMSPSKTSTTASPEKAQMRGSDEQRVAQVLFVVLTTRETQCGPPANTVWSTRANARRTRAASRAKDMLACSFAGGAAFAAQKALSDACCSSAMGAAFAGEAVADEQQASLKASDTSSLRLHTLVVSGR